MIELRPDQVDAARHLAKVVRARGAGIDASDTGVGKTYTALGVTKLLGRMPLVVCPKAVIPSWERVLEASGLPHYGVYNYERACPARRGKSTTAGIKLGGWKVYGRVYEWGLSPDRALIVFDEAHRLKTRTSNVSKLAVAAKRQGIPCLFLSATLAESPLDLYAVGYALGLHNGGRSFLPWACEYGVYRGYFSWEFRATAENLARLHGLLFPDCGVRIRAEDTGAFTECLYSADLVQVDRKAVRSIEAVAQELDQLKESLGEAELPVTEFLRLRQIAETAKLPALCSMVVDSGDCCNVVFLNFRKSVMHLGKLLAANDVEHVAIVGGMPSHVVGDKIQAFQSGAVRCILCQIDAGGVGISLHDTIGGHRRQALISPPLSARVLKQALGRVHRAGSKTVPIQRLVFAAGTVEERVRARVSDKLTRLDLINDNDLNPLF